MLMVKWASSIFGGAQGVSLFLIVGTGNPLFAETLRQVTPQSQEIAVLEEKVRSMDQRIRESIESVTKMAKEADERQRETITEQKKSQDSLIEYLAKMGSWAFVILTGISGLLGWMGVSRFRNWKDKAEGAVKDAEKARDSIRQIEVDARNKVAILDRTMKRNTIDVRALEAVTRVMPRIGRSDLETDPDAKKRLASEALSELSEAQRLNEAKSASLLLEKGKALKRLGRYIDALLVAREAAELAKTEQNKYDEARAYYNAACYLALSQIKEEKESALRYLAQASSISPTFKQFAVEDKDFDSLRNDRLFQDFIKT